MFTTDASRQSSMRKLMLLVMKRLIYLIPVALLMISSCKEDPPKPEPQDPPVLRISTALMNDGQEIELNDEFLDGAGNRVKLVALKFYLANMEMIDDGGNAYALSEIELFDHKPFDDALSTPQWVNEYELEVKDATYQKIKFDLGVPPALNDDDPATFDNNDPLSVYSNMYWSWASMYRFIILEARMDSTGGTNFDHDLIFHTGLEDLYRTGIELPAMFSIDSSEVKELKINIEWDKLFYDGAEPIVVRQENITHTTAGPEAFNLAERFTENFIVSLSSEH